METKLPRTLSTGTYQETKEYIDSLISPSPGPDPDPELDLLRQWYPGIELTLGILPDNDIKAVLYDASWDDPYHVFCTDRKDETGHAKTALYVGQTLETLTRHGVVLDNEPDIYSFVGNVIVDTISPGRLVMSFTGPNGDSEKAGFATSTDGGFTWTLFSPKFKIGTGLGNVGLPEDYNGYFADSFFIHNNTYYALLTESNELILDLRLALWKTTDPNFAAANWIRVGTALELGAGWDGLYVAQGMLIRSNNKWACYYQGTNGDNTERHVGVAFPNDPNDIEDIPYIRYVNNPVLAEVTSFNPASDRVSFVGYPKFFFDPVTQQLRLFYRAYMLDYTVSTPELAWRAKEALLEHPGITWWHIRVDLTGVTTENTISEIDNQTLRYTHNAFNTVQCFLLENNTSKPQIRAQIDPAGKSRSAAMCIGFSENFVNPNGSLAGWWVMALRNVSPFNEIQILENGVSVQIVATTINAGDVFRVDASGANMLYYHNDNLVYTGAAPPSTLYPGSTRTSTFSGTVIQNWFNIKILTDRIG